MESKQTSSGIIDEVQNQKKIVSSKEKFRRRQLELSFNEKMKIALELQKRNEQLRKARKIA